MKSQPKKKAMQSSDEVTKSKIDSLQSLKKSHLSHASARICNKPNLPSSASIQYSNLSTSQNNSMDAICDSKRNHCFSLIEIDNLENRVLCVDRKLMIADFSYDPEIFNSYYVTRAVSTKLTGDLRK